MAKSKSDRLEAALRENLKRRKAQKTRQAADPQEDFATPAIQVEDTAKDD